MSDEQTRRIVEDSYDDFKEETLRAMARDWFSRKMLSTQLLVWTWAIPLIAVSVYSAIQFFKSEQTQAQIMYATLFIVATNAIGLMKVLAWLMLQRHSIRRDLKQMELRLAELHERLSGR